MYYPVENGVEKRIESWRLIVPLFDNDQNKIRTDVVTDIKEKVIEEFGGLTMVNVVGYWKSGEKVFEDNNIEIVVDAPVEEGGRAAAFFGELKHSLMKSLKQEKIYITKEDAKSELLSPDEFLYELGFEIPPDQPQKLDQYNIDLLVEKSEIIKLRANYKTLSLSRIREEGKIIWEREIFGVKLVTVIRDKYHSDAVLLPADNLEAYFTKETFGKPCVIIGDYEYQSYILDKEKKRYIVGNPCEYVEFDEAGESQLYFTHEWQGRLTPSAFIALFPESVLINYIILREMGISEKDIKISVGSDGSLQIGDKIVLFCPVIIESKRLQDVILHCLKKAINNYESGTIDEIALMQAKVMNRYNLKKAQIKMTVKSKRSA